MTTITGNNALLVLAALAALSIVAITVLAIAGAPIPLELSGALLVLISAATGGGVVKSADAINDERARREELQAAWRKTQ